VTSPDDDVLARLSALADAMGPAFAPTQTADLLETIAGTAKELFGAAACSLGLLTEDESEIVFHTTVGAGAEEFRGTRMAAGKGIAGWVAMTGQPMAVSELRRDQRFAVDVAEQSGYVPDAILAVPIATDDRVLGVLEVLDRDASRPDADQDIRLVTLFARQAALAIEGAQAFRHLGRTLFTAAAHAAARDGDVGLAEALDAAGAANPGADPEAAEVAALFAELRAAGPAERQLAARLLREVLAYARRRERRPV
jgi:GAF domain-containing protein